MSIFSNLNTQQLVNFAEHLTSIAEELATTYDKLCIETSDVLIIRENLTELSGVISEVVDLRDDVLEQIGVASGIG